MLGYVRMHEVHDLWWTVFVSLHHMAKGPTPLQIVASMQINSLRSILKQACGVKTLGI